MDKLVTRNMSNSRSRLVVYACFLQVVAGTVFFVGFFALRQHVTDISSESDLPSSVNGYRLNSSILYRRHYSKIVLIVIDALRLDFTTESGQMPFLSQQLQNPTTCHFAARAAVPTVTLPRIKALVTGAVPEFLDVISNFGASELTADNIITQANRFGYNIVFYGDDTWLRLFPNSFKRYEGTSSFFVNDFYEVDLNVTRNMKKELLGSDWDMMILHFLGLDHIGHVEGPYGSSIASKLKEMDDVLKEIAQYMDKLKANGMDGLVILTGDHGMKNSGGHGGSSYEEVTVPVVLMNSGCSYDSGEQFQQVDLAPLLATLMGVPIPAGSSGKLNPKLLGKLLPNETLYSVYYNTLRMKNHLSSAVTSEISDEFNEGLRYYSSWITNNFDINYSKQAVLHFLNAQEKIALKTASPNELNILSTVVAIVLLFQGLVLLFSEQSRDVVLLASFANKSVWLLIFLVVTLLVVMVYWAEIVYQALNATIISQLVAVGLLLNNIRLLIPSKFTCQAIKGLKLYFPLVVLLPLSYMSTSYIEEEHEYWYFTFATLLAYKMFKEGCHLGQAVFPTLLVMQRFLKTLNQTGDKWANLPDVGGWLRAAEQNLEMLAFYSFGLIYSIFVNWMCGLRKSTAAAVIDASFILLQGFSIFLFNSATGQLQAVAFNSKSRGTFEVKCFWLFTALRVVAAMIYWKRYNTNANSSANYYSEKIISIAVQLHLSIVCLLAKPHNVLFAPSLVLFSKTLSSSTNNWKELELIHYWLGMVFFFYMGNSNSIASIDVTAGFVGLNDFQFTSGVLIVLHLYASPILSYLLLLKEWFAAKKFEEDCSTVYLLLNGLPLMVFMVSIVAQREHLFIWSVFSPKLLYLLCQTLLVAFVIVLKYSLKELSQTAININSVPTNSL